MRSVGQYQRLQSAIPFAACQTCLPPAPGPHWGPPPPTVFGRPARWPTFIAIAIALIGVAVGFIGWFRPAPHTNQPPPKPTYTAQQAADTKAKVCAAFGKVQHSRDLVQEQVGSSDHATQLGVAALTEIDLDFTNRYLLTTLAEEPATPPELAATVRKQADAFQEILINYLDGLYKSDPAMQPALNASDEATATIQRLCK